MVQKKRKSQRRSRFALRENQQRAERAEAEVTRIKSAFVTTVALVSLLVDQLTEQVLGR